MGATRLRQAAAHAWNSNNYSPSIADLPKSMPPTIVSSSFTFPTCRSSKKTSACMALDEVEQVVHPTTLAIFQRPHRVAFLLSSPALCTCTSRYIGRLSCLRNNIDLTIPLYVHFPFHFPVSDRYTYHSSRYISHVVSHPRYNCPSQHCSNVRHAFEQRARPTVEN